MSDPGAFFLTGVTGALGRDLTAELLKTGPEKLFLLIRRKGRHSPLDRARKIFAPLGLDNLLGTRLEALEGDVSLPGFGLRPEEIERLKNEVTVFYHAAALTALNGGKQDCERTNLGGTRQALELAHGFHKLKRFVYFSTAYVAGSLQDYLSPEDRLPEKPAHANFYESSKYAAEKEVRQAMAAGLPATILRPSIVVGHSQTGEVPEFNVIYPFIRLFAHGILRTLPTRLDHAFNIVPIDFVVKASAAITRRPESLGKTYHLVSENPPTIGMLLRLKEEDYPAVPAVKVVEPENFKKEALRGEEQLVFAMLEPYLGYLNGRLRFDTRNTREILRGTEVEFPRTDYEFLRALIRHAFDAGYLVKASS